MANISCIVFCRSVTDNYDVYFGQPKIMSRNTMVNVSHYFMYQ